MKYATFTAALAECVRVAGGPKVVASLLWPNVPFAQAHRRLCSSLNPSRAEKLSPSDVLTIMRLARDRGCHAGAEYLMAALSYAPPQPVEPKDEADQLRREVVEGMRALQATMARLEQLDRPVARRVA